MNRRQFVSQSCLLSISTIGLPSVLSASSSLSIKNSSFKSLCLNGQLKKIQISDDLKNTLINLTQGGTYTNIGSAYQYDDNLMVEVESENLLFNEKGFLFITSDKNHLFISENNLVELDELLNNYLLRLQEQNIKASVTEVMLPYQIQKSNDTVFSFKNKFGNEIKLKVKRKNRFITISQ